MGRLAVEGDRSIYFEHHAGEGRPVVLIHGWGMSCRVWDTVLPVLLDAGHEVAALDHRGCGSSDKDFAEISVPAIASDVLALVGHLSLAQPVLSGWSLGGAVAAEAAAKLGDELGGLVLTGGATPRYLQAEGYPYGGTQEILEETCAALRNDRPNFLAGLSAGVCHTAVGQPVIDWMWQIFMQAAPTADAALLDLGNVEHRELLKTIDAPALVMAGTHDAIVPFDIARVAAELLPKGRLVEFADSGHAPFLEEPERYRRELLEFLRAL